MQFQSTRNPQHRVGLSDAIARGPGAGRRTVRPDRAAGASIARRSTAPHTMPEVAEVLLRPFAAGDAIAAAAAGHRPRRLQLPGAARGSGGGGGTVVSAGAVPRPDRGIQGFRRAVPRGLARAHSPQRSASADDPGRDLRRHGWRRSRGVLPASLGRRRGALSEGPRLGPPGTAARVLGQRTCARWRLRGTFDDCQRMVKEAFVDPALGSRPAAVVGEQHQRRPAAAADGVLRAVEPRAVPPRRSRAQLHRALGQPGQRGRLPLGAQGGPADRRSRCWRRTPT